MIFFRFDAVASDKVNAEKEKKIPGPIILTDHYIAAGSTVRAAYLAGVIDGLSLYSGWRPGVTTAHKIRTCLDGQSITEVAENLNERLVHAPATSGKAPATSSIIKELATYCGLDLKP